MNCDLSRPDCETDVTNDARHCGNCDTDCTALDPLRSQGIKGWKCISGACYALCQETADVGGGMCRFVPFISAVSCTKDQCLFWCADGHSFCGTETNPQPASRGCYSTSSLCASVDPGTKEF